MSKLVMATTAVDILIIGAGPAGLTLANWFRNSNISVLLVDKKPGRTPRGQAEGLKSTTNEIFDTFGIGQQIASESWRLEEIAVWGARKDGGQGIVREQIVPDKVEELGKPRETILQQSRVEHHLLQNIISLSNIEIRYSTSPVSVEIDASCPHLSDSHPVTVILARVTDEQGSTEVNGSNGSSTVEGRQVVRAKYIVGCDGAHSWLRKQLNVTLEGSLTDSVFGVVDLIPKTNFPDIRKVCYLRASAGTVLIVPRSGKEVRLYVPVESGSALPSPKDLTLDQIFSAARQILHPYTLSVSTVGGGGGGGGGVSWWSAYRVGQRVGSRFSAGGERAFLVGDAVHTHSPKAGQGMNTSIQDAYNLGWKLRLVLSQQQRKQQQQQKQEQAQGRWRGAAEALLRTYETERRPVALDLIAFDRGYLQLFSARGRGRTAQQAEEKEMRFDGELHGAMKFTTGLSIRYAPSCVVRLPRGVRAGELGPSLLKADLVPGKRLQDVQVVCQADGVTTRIQNRMRATGAFRVVAFAGDIAIPGLLGRLQRLGEFLADPVAGLGELTMAPAESPFAVWEKLPVEVLVVHCAEREQVNLLELHEVFVPWSSDDGYDYWRVYADTESTHDGHGRAYERLELDREKGCVAVIRPDGYVGAVVDMDDFEGLKGCFEGVGLL